MKGSIVREFSIAMKLIIILFSGSALLQLPTQQLMSDR